MELKVLTLNDREEWRELLDKCENRDIYFTPEYLEIQYNHYSKEIDDYFYGEPICVYFGEKENFVLLPTLRREINELEFFDSKKKYYDLISGYGYAGPLFSNLKEAKNLAKLFMREYSNYCKKNNIVCEFIRFHPITKNQEYFEGIESIDLIPSHTTVKIDLTKSEEDLVSEMNKKTRNLLRKAQKSGLKVEISNSFESLNIFTKIYLETMDKNDATSHYFLDKPFFKKTRELLGNNLRIIKILKDEEVISCALFMNYGKYLHYHFAGSKKEFLNLAPNNLLIFEAIKLGKELGCEILHLGGGRNSSPDEPLFKFKSGFSRDSCKFYMGKIIHDKETYEKLSKLKLDFEKKNGIKNDNTGFFPLYRR